MSKAQAIQLPEKVPEYRLPILHRWKVPLLFGPMRGSYWLPFSRGKLLRLFSGRYEPDQTAKMQELVGPGHVFFDIGAAVGYYTVLAAPLVGRQGRVVAFEPDPKNAAFLRQHVAINDLSNVDVRQAAIGNTNGFARFTGGSGSGTGRLADSGTTVVEVCRLDDLISQIGLPTHMKIDVEGAELDLLHGARQTLLRARPTLFLSTHGPRMYDSCRQFLTELGYDVLPISSNPKYASEILCIGPKVERPVKMRRAG